MAPVWLVGYSERKGAISSPAMPVDQAQPPPMLEESTDCIKVMDIGGRLLSMNPEGLCLMEIDAFEPLEGAL